MNIDCYRHPDDFPLDVAAFFAAASAGHVEGSADWFRNLVDQVYPADGGVHFYVLRKNGSPVVALPVRVNRSAFGWQLESLGNYYTSLYAPLLAPGATVSDLSALLQGIQKAHAPLAVMRFDPLDAQGPTFRMLQQALAASGFKPFTFFRFGNWCLPVKEDGSTYLQNRPGALRSTLKRMGKKFAADGGTLRVIQGGTDLERGLASYLQVYAASWKKAEGYPGFVPGLIRTCASKGWLRLGIASLGQQPVAAQIWIVSEGKASIYKLAYDERFKAYAPGTLLTAQLMQHAIDVDAVAEVDYLIGDDPYKQDWMTERRERWGIVAYNPATPLGLLGWCKETLTRTLKRTVHRWRTSS